MRDAVDSLINVRERVRKLEIGIGVAAGVGYDVHEWTLGESGDPTQLHLVGGKSANVCVVWGGGFIESYPSVYGPVIPEEWWPDTRVGVKLTLVDTSSGPMEVVYVDSWITTEGMLQIGEVVDS